MKLISISVQNYRSITEAYKISLGDTTVLVGPNNEGKSNLLLALVMGMNVLTEEQFADRLRAGSNRMRFRSHDFYDWKRDFPIRLQSTQPKGQTTIVLEFGLTDDELDSFRRQIQTALSGSLPVKIAIGSSSDITVSVHKKGPGAKTLSQKSAKIAAFVSERLRLEHIPAVRTANSAQKIVEELVARELKRLETDSEYQKAVARVAALQEPLLRTLSDNIKNTLVQFLPDVRDVRITASREDRYRALRQSCSIIVDDGTATALQHKGDGVQSLAALAVMRHASERASASKHSVIAIEEPESHLHPGAIHELRAVLSEMSLTNQLVLTSHNPLFVNRANVAANIIVTDNKARPARSIDEVRDILGVRASDNLRSAALVLVVEGEDDRVAVTALLKDQSPRLRNALNSGMLALDTLQGATNLAYKLGLLRDSLCTFHCFLDNDVSGLAGLAKAQAQGLVTLADITLANCPGRPESEIEDLYDPAIYEALIGERYGVVLSSPKFKNSKKWSVRISETFKQQGKPWNERLEAEVKRLIVLQVVDSPGTTLIGATRSAFDALATTISEKLDRLQSGLPRRRPTPALKAVAVPRPPPSATVAAIGVSLRDTISPASPKKESAQ